MAECNHDCSSCSSNCGDRTAPLDFTVAPHKWSNVKHVIGIVSGKGGVGKSLVTSRMACAMKERGNTVGMLEADITGPPIPKAFGIHEKAMGNNDGIFPCQSATGIDVMSVNLLLPNETDPVVWRGSMIANAVIPVSARRGYYHRNLSSGAGFHDRRQGGKDGRDDEHPDPGFGRELLLFPLP